MLNKETKNADFKNKVLKSALSYSHHETPKMSLADNTFFPVVLIREISLRLRKNNRLKNSFPRGYLLNGIFDYAQATNNKKTIVYIEKTVNRFVENIDNGELKYIDQACMGMVLIKLYEYTKNEKYRSACDNIAHWLLKNIDSKYNVILYRPNVNYQYVDTLGMICPFLLAYATAFNKNEFIDLSNKQIIFYINHGLNKNGMPYHAIDLNNFFPMGSSNWGRGLGWYMLALTATLKYTDTENNSMYGYFKNEFDKIAPHLKNLKKDQFWGQFIGVSKNWHNDTSVSCMLFYSLSLLKEENCFEEFYKFLKPLTTKKGQVDYTSGDTEDINIYSREYGKSELTQGLILSIFKNEITP
ncbi:glycoside hydrolase family 88 protein [Flavobacteriaceae bacterium SZ-1-7]|uniref:glycoside hydrolase family 88 protein n=1 Tax=Tamlana sedimenti TaxID=3134126 RepID=UPI0031287FAD